MYPEIADVKIFGWHIEIMSYTLFLGLAAVTVVSVGYWTAIRRGMHSHNVLICMIAAAVSVPIGARLLHAALNPEIYQANPERFFSYARTGFSLYGGLLLAALTVVIFTKFTKLDLWSFADAIAPALGLGIAVTRAGCFLNGCCAGTITDLPWGVISKSESQTGLHNIAGMLGIVSIPAPSPVHPTQIYELLAALAGSLIAIIILNRKMTSGSAFLTFTAWFTTFRWFNWHLRVPAETFNAPSWFYPIFYACIIIVAIFLYLTRTREQSLLPSLFLDKDSVSNRPT